MTLPIFRPLIGYDKEDIVALARKIGTFLPLPGDTSCGVLPQKPVTTSVQQVIEGIEYQLQTDEMIRTLVLAGERMQALNGVIIS